MIIILGWCRIFSINGIGINLFFFPKLMDVLMLNSFFKIMLMRFGVTSVANMMSAMNWYTWTYASPDTLPRFITTLVRYGNVQDLTEVQPRRNAEMLLMVQKSGDHQLRLIVYHVYPIIYRVSVTSQVVIARFLPSTYLGISSSSFLVRGFYKVFWRTKGVRPWGNWGGKGNLYIIARAPETRGRSLQLGFLQLFRGSLMLSIDWM